MSVGSSKPTSYVVRTARLIIDSLTPHISISSRWAVSPSNRRIASAFCSSLRAARFALTVRSNPARRNVSQAVFRRTSYLSANSYVELPAS